MPTFDPKFLNPRVAHALVGGEQDRQETATLRQKIDQTYSNLCDQGLTMRNEFMDIRIRIQDLENEISKLQVTQIKKYKSDTRYLKAMCIGLGMMLIVTFIAIGERIWLVIQ